MHTLTYTALVPAPLVWASDAVGTVLLLSGLTGSLLLVILRLRSRHERLARVALVIKPVKAGSPVHRAAA